MTRDYGDHGDLLDTHIRVFLLIFLLLRFGLFFDPSQVLTTK